jgi:hypothetical protein
MGSGRRPGIGDVNDLVVRLRVARRRRDRVAVLQVIRTCAQRERRQESGSDEDKALSA